MIRAVFIGLDRHRDSAIRELTGARRDATALWALFSDTIDDLQSELLINENATLDRVRAALEGVLRDANETDTVVISFSGHGTHDHKFVMHDTEMGALDTTTLPMARAPVP